MFGAKRQSPDWNRNPLSYERNKEASGRVIGTLTIHLEIPHFDVENVTDVS